MSNSSWDLQTTVKSAMANVDKPPWLAPILHGDGPHSKIRL